MKQLLSVAIFAWVAVITGAQAQTVTDCDRWEANIRNLAEPWEDNTRTFANGNVRVALIDTVEPAVVPLHLLILSPPLGVLGDPQCRMISAGSNGFSGIDFENLIASYDPATGLGLYFQIQVYNSDTADFEDAGLDITINQATGDITAFVGRAN